MKIRVNLKENSYPVYVQKGVLDKVGELADLDRKVLVVTDDGVPDPYAQKVLSKCKEGYLFRFKNGERSKNVKVLQSVLKALLYNGFTRADCIVAVGGGVVGDLAGFAASVYMRGIDFYNCPTTLLSQVDSSVGGKTAIDFYGVKNAVGSFYQPKAVFADINALKTLDYKQLTNGLAESVKMAACLDKELFYKIKECDDINKILTSVVIRSVKIKKAIVEKDEKEAGLRKVLNFGHTVGHAVESYFNGKLLHGRAVCIGMAAVSDGMVKQELISAFKKYRLPVKATYDKEKVLAALLHDKKFSGDTVDLVTVPEIGSFSIKKVDVNYLKTII